MQVFSRIKELPSNFHSQTKKIYFDCRAKNSNIYSSTKQKTTKAAKESIEKARYAASRMLFHFTPKISFKKESITSQQAGNFISGAAMCAYVTRYQNKWLKGTELYARSLKQHDNHITLEKGVRFSGPSLIDEKLGLKMTIIRDRANTEKIYVVMGPLYSLDTDINQKGLKNYLARFAIYAAQFQAIVHNLLGGQPALFRKAERQLQNIIEAYPNADIELRGQSLGGALASYLAQRKKLKAECYNPLPIGVGLQHAIGSKQLKKADLFVTNVSTKWDYCSDLPQPIIAIDFLLNKIFRIRTPGVFGKRLRLPSTYIHPEKNHCYFLGSLMKFTGFNQRDLPCKFFKEKKQKSHFENQINKHKLDLKSNLEKTNLNKEDDHSIRVAMVSAECAKIIKQGGLAEAVYGLAEGILKENPNNQVKIILPKYDLLPSNLDLIKSKKIVKRGEEEFSVYKTKIGGQQKIKCYFIDQGANCDKFNIRKSDSSPGSNLSIYGPDAFTEKARFAHFSGLAAELLKQLKDRIDIIQLHEWQTAAVAKILSQTTEWTEGSIPATIFTYHNTSAQGVYISAQEIKMLTDCGLNQAQTNIMREAIHIADMVNTVSKTYSVESRFNQGNGLESTLNICHKNNKLFGIVNGCNISESDPAQNSQLQSWLDPTKKTPCPLNYTDSDNIVEKKKIIKKQLDNYFKSQYQTVISYIEENYSDQIYKFPKHIQIDPEKPVIFFVGRYDSKQKGLQLFEAAIEETLNQGSQFVTIGCDEDETAKKILDNLQKKYKNEKNVIILRDMKDRNGKLMLQEGIQNHPFNTQGIGQLLKAASTFFFIPSIYEPCGQIQFEGRIMGSAAIAAKTGGLSETICEQGEFRQGYLFQGQDRLNDDSKPSSTAVDNVKFAIRDGLICWKDLTFSQQNQWMSSLIQEGRKCSWNDPSPSGLSPVKEYEQLYKAAIKSVKENKRSKNQALSEEIAAFEKAYDDPKISSKELKRWYKELSNTARSCVHKPPYTQRCINPNRHLEYGAHASTQGTSFTLFAPAAKQVDLLLVDFKEDEWQVVERHHFNKNHEGVWQSLLTEVKPGDHYLYEITSMTGEIRQKIDPYSFCVSNQVDKKYKPASIVANPLNQYHWNDHDWMAKRKLVDKHNQPLNIYEVHLPTWQQQDQDKKNFKELAKQLVEYCKKMKYTHIELMGLLDHPVLNSMGYQVTGFFAPRRGYDPNDVKYLIELCHQNQIGVILDWVPAHFAIDSYSYAQLDGSPLYEERNFDCANHPLWGTFQFDYNNNATRDMLLSSAAYWLDVMHIDGLRVDAVESILKPRNEKYEPLGKHTKKGFSKSGKAFLRDLNSFIHKKHPDVLTIAEDFSDYPKTVERIQGMRGLGFDMMWNKNWYFKNLEFFALPLKERCKNDAHTLFTDAIQRIKNNKQVLIFSHDFFDQASSTLLEITPGLEREEKFANVRLLLSYMICLPGKKLTFMGNEFASKRDWKIAFQEKNHPGLNWGEINDPLHSSTQTMVQELNEIYLKNAPFWKDEQNELKVVDMSDINNFVISYQRATQEGEQLICIHNMSSNYFNSYVINLPVAEYCPELKNIRSVKEIFNSDDSKFGGKGRTNPQVILNNNISEGPDSIVLTLAPLSTIILKANNSLEDV